MESNLWTSLVLPVLVIIGGFISGILFASSVLSDADRPMPCDEHQVLVWVSYPSEAHCVDDTAHEEHAG